MATSLTLISHASTVALRRAAFPSDERLDPSAYRKAASVERLHRADRRWRAPELRTTETAHALALEATVEPALRDCEYGRWRGRALAELEAEEPEAVAAWLNEPQAKPHGGESLLELIGRIGGWLDRIGDEKGRVIAVTHPAVIRAAIVHAIGVPASTFWRIDVAPLTRTELRGRKGRWTLRSSGVPL